MEQSKRFSLNKNDFLYIWDRAKLFLIPLAVIYIPFVIDGIQKDGFQLSDFQLNQIQQGALILYVLNRILTAGQLFLQGPKK